MPDLATDGKPDGLFSHQDGRYGAVQRGMIWIPGRNGVSIAAVPRIYGRLLKRVGTVGNKAYRVEAVTILRTIRCAKRSHSDMFRRTSRLAGCSFLALQIREKSLPSRYPIMYNRPWVVSAVAHGSSKPRLSMEDGLFSSYGPACGRSAGPHATGSLL